MFYSQFILAKKGPLGTIWIAAHLERKLRKNQVADTDIGVSVDSILFPDVPIALRLSSHLLLGVVRIYSRKVNYLFDDCSDALLKVKQAFRSTAVDLPPEQSKAPYHSITLPETFDLDDFELPDNELFQGNYVDRHVSTREQITLQDTMEGVAFPTSQFGPDERFGDGDASQIGLDLDEDLFLHKGEPAGMSENLDCATADHEASKQAKPFRGDEQNEGVSSYPSASPINCVSIQAPSTPGLVEEPNFSAQEVLISDEHMDDDQNLPELGKEVSGTASSQVERCHTHKLLLNSNGDCRHLDDQESAKERSETAIYDHEAVEPTSSGNAKPFKFNEHIEAMSGVDGLGSELSNCNLLKEKDTACDIQSKGQSGHQNKVARDGIEMLLADNGISTSVSGRSSSDDCQKSDLYGTYLPVSDHGSGDNISLVGRGDLSTEENEGIIQIDGSDWKTEGQNLKKPETLETNGGEKTSAGSTAGLQACNSRFLGNGDGVENVADASSLLAEDEGLHSLGISGKENVANVTENSIDLQDLTNPNLKADEISHEFTCANNSNLPEPLDTIGRDEDHLGEENDFRGSDLSAPEKLLSVPNVPATQAGDALLEWTPGKYNLAEGVDGSGEKFIFGKKRSYTESTLTIQSQNSESSSAAQSKQSVEYIPGDDDLLSSILGGKGSTGLKMKPTPPVTDCPATKRQRVSVRSSTQKRKVPVDYTMVLHGDTIREQLTNTEDIRRVRKKAPCTRFEVWVLQKHFLEDEVFSEPVFTGMVSNLRSLHREAVDLTGIRIAPGDERKSANEALTPLTAGDVARLEHADTFEETPCRQESMIVVDGSILQKELETFDNEVAKQMSQNEESGKKVETVNYDGRTEPRGEVLSVASRLEASLSATPPEVNLASDTNTDLPYTNNTTDGVRSVDTNSHQLLDPGYHLDLTRDDVSLLDGVSGSGRESQEVVDASEKNDLEEKLDGTCLFERTEGVSVADKVAATAELEDVGSLPFCDAVTESLSHESGISPTLDKVTEEFQLSEPMFASAEQNFASDLRKDDGCAMVNNHLAEDMTVDSSNSFEADLVSRKTQLDERENLECCEADPKSFTNSTAIPAESIDPTEHADIWRDAVEHDTDFLNVDDDDVAEDYENDMPNSDEKRILDNSGWSTRTRAVANYLQVLFEKEAYHADKVISLENLLAGKSRKEASRMFFETLVLHTKDYINTEQEGSYSHIKIKPTGKLLKSEFFSHK